MGKAIVIVALILLLTGIVLAVSIQESRTEEGILDRWDPIKPSKLSPQNSTSWVFMIKTLDGTFLELNVSASDVVRVRIGNYTIAEVTGEVLWETLVFDQIGTRFTQRVAIAGTGADFLEIKNEGANIVNISGNIKKIGNIRQSFHPYLGLGTLAALFGLILLIYGVSAKPKKRRFKGNSGTSAL